MPLPQSLSRAVLTPGFVAYKLSRRIRSDPYAWLRLAQRVDPVHHSALGPWIIMSHSAATAALKDPRIGRLEHRGDEEGFMKSALLRRIFKRTAPEVKENSAFYRLWSATTIFRDPVISLRLKSYLSRMFTPRRLIELRPGIQEYVDRALDKAAERGRIEVVGDLAQRLPARIICQLIGVPPEDEHVIIENGPKIVHALEASPMRSPETLEAGNRAAEALLDYMAALVNARKESPADDLVSALKEEDEDGVMSDADLIATLVALLFAGSQSTASFIGNGVLALLRNRDELARWRDDASIERTAVEELLRYDSPSMMTIHDALEDVELGGRLIQRGSLVMILTAAANHDPRAFDDPARLDLTRDPNPHVTFGGGPHFCMGAALARLESAAFFSSFVTKFPEARLAPDGLVRRDGLTTRVLRKLEILTR
jgi:pimeloyl-[acyl-carrier protein] synthase